MIAYSLLSNNVLSCCKYVISSQDTKKGHNNVSLLLQRYQDSNLEMLESESSALPFGDSAIYYKKYLIIEARDGIRTRDPRLGKAILHH